MRGELCQRFNGECPLCSASVPHSVCRPLSTHPCPQVKNYFNTEGFERWRKIYGDETAEVNKVQLDIRTVRCGGEWWGRGEHAVRGRDGRGEQGAA